MTKSLSCFFQGVGKGDVTSLRGIHCDGGLEVGMSTGRSLATQHHTSVLWLGCASLCGNWVLWVDQRVGCSVCRTIVNMQKPTKFEKIERHAHHACSPLLQGGLIEEELSKVALTCHPALDVIFRCHDRTQVFNVSNLAVHGGNDDP